MRPVNNNHLHICPFCSKEYWRDTPAVPMSKPCPECWLNRDDAIVILSKDDWVFLMDILITAHHSKNEESKKRIVDIYHKTTKQVMQTAKETIDTIMSEKETNARQKKR